MKKPGATDGHRFFSNMTRKFFYLVIFGYLESEKFWPSNQGLSLRFMRAIWMASPIHWSADRLRVL
jgi:hypothetical protein